MSLFLFLTVSVGYSTMRVVQKEVTVSRALAGRIYVKGTSMPARDVTVELCTAGWKTVLATTRTDAQGYFVLKVSNSKKLFYVRLSAPGMDIYELRVRIDKNVSQDLTLYLSVAT